MLNKLVLSLHVKTVPDMDEKSLFQEEGTPLQKVLPPAVRVSS